MNDHQFTKDGFEIVGAEADDQTMDIQSQCTSSDRHFVMSEQSQCKLGLFQTLINCASVVRYCDRNVRIFCHSSEEWLFASIPTPNIPH